MKIVFNTSPVIFLSKLHYIDPVLDYFKEIIIPEGVYTEIKQKHDQVFDMVSENVSSEKIIVHQISLERLYEGLRERIGRGEAEAISLSIEIKADIVVLDDNAARKEAARLGLNVIGTLGLIKNLSQKKKLILPDLNILLGELRKVDFRVSDSIFFRIFQG